MTLGERRRVNQKLHQARLLLMAAKEPQDELQQLAWQQTCYEAALAALQGAFLAFLRELAAAYRLPATQVLKTADLERLAAVRQQRLPELQQLKAYQTDPAGALAALQADLAQLELQKLPEAAAEDAWQAKQGDIPLHSVDREEGSLEERQLVKAEDYLKQLQTLFATLREQLLED